MGSHADEAGSAQLVNLGVQEDGYDQAESCSSGDLLGDQSVGLSLPLLSLVDGTAKGHALDEQTEEQDKELEPVPVPDTSTSPNGVIEHGLPLSRKSVPVPVPALELPEVPAAAAPLPVPTQEPAVEMAGSDPAPEQEAAVEDNNGTEDMALELVTRDLSTTQPGQPDPEGLTRFAAAIESMFLDSCDLLGLELEAVPADVCRLAGRVVSPDDEGNVLVGKSEVAGLYRMLERVPRSRVLQSLTLESFAQHLRTCKNVVIMCGAGISVAAGIPDFRTPGTGLYSQLGKYNLPTPEAMFHIRYFRKRPHAFYRFAEELWPGKYQPTKVHKMMKLFEDKGVLRRVYTQNIDGLERAAGLSLDHLVEAHGHMAFAHCIDCNSPFAASFVKNKLERGVLPLCPCCRTSQVPIPLLDAEEEAELQPVTQTQTAMSQDLFMSQEDDPAGLPDIKGLIKPRIVFFGENLPSRFTTLSATDMEQADALIIIGTSLSVQPFSCLPAEVSRNCPRLLITKGARKVASRAGFVTSKEYGYRDVVLDGDCQESVDSLLDALGWSMPREPTGPLIPIPTQPDLSTLAVQ